jgi:hypothetical protein
MSKNSVFIAITVLMIIASVSSAPARGHYRGGHWGGCYNSCGWGFGYSSPYYYGGYHNAYPYNYITVETPVVRTVTTVTHVHDTVTQQQSPTSAIPKDQAQPARPLASTLKDTLALQQPIIGDTTTIYVPNSAGRFTAVKLVAHGNGYTGPQGEFYPHSPTVAQLRALYSY